MNLRHLFRRYDYRARVNYTFEDINCVPLDSIQTDEELVNFILVKVNQGLYVSSFQNVQDQLMLSSRCMPLGVDLIPGADQMYQEKHLLQAVDQEGES